ncbi:MAG: hypothetical protein AB1390_01075 [Nitrospirota bacterium]
MNKLSILTALTFIILVTGCATEESRNVTHQIERHPHAYPFTEVMDDYHVRLEVDHMEGKMFLIFEDISEKPTKLLELKRIKGELTLPDGTVRNKTFRPIRTLFYRPQTRRASTYVVQDEWLKTTPNFILKVEVPFEGKDYELIFNYTVPGGEIPLHRGRLPD